MAHKSHEKFRKSLKYKFHTVEEVDKYIAYLKWKINKNDNTLFTLRKYDQISFNLSSLHDKIKSDTEKIPILEEYKSKLQEKNNENNIKA